MKPRIKGDKYRPVVTVLVSIDGVPVKVRMSGKTYVLKSFKQRKGKWKKHATPTSYIKQKPAT